MANHARRIELTASDRVELERLQRSAAGPAGPSRRARAVLLLAGETTGAEVARLTGYTPVQVSRIRRRFVEEGLAGLIDRPRSGRPAKLSKAQRRDLVQALKRGAQAAGFPTARWTLRRVQQVIAREFGVVYHPQYLNRLLRRLGWSWQQPLPRATERDEELIRAWLAQDWPRIKKSAATRRAHRVLR